MKLPYFIYFTLIPLVSLFAQPIEVQDRQQNFINKETKANYPVTSWNAKIGSSKIDIRSASNEPSSMNNFICDAMLERTETEFSFINYGDISASLAAGDISELDLFAICPFDRSLVILEVDGAFLLSLLEKSVSGFRCGLATGGGKVELNPNRPSGNRLTYFQIGSYPVYPKKDYRVVTTDYFFDGHCDLNLFSQIDSSKVFRTGILLRDALRQYIVKHTPLGPASVRIDDRWIKQP